MKINNVDWNNINLENIYDCILEISDIEEQKRIWNGNTPNIIASYDDVMLSLFDDFLFDNFIDDYLNAIEISIEFKEKIILFRDKLKLFDGYSLNYKKITKHPNWVEISKIAQDVLRLWRDNGLAFYKESDR